MDSRGTIELALDAKWTYRVGAPRVVMRDVLIRTDAALSARSRKAMGPPSILLVHDQRQECALTCCQTNGDYLGT